MPATLRECDRWYIDFKYETADGKLKRARHYVSGVIKHMTTLKARRAYALNEVDVINQKLRAGWTPEMDRALANVPKSGALVLDVLVEYREWIKQSEKRGELRHATAVSYASFVNLFENWVKTTKVEHVFQLKEEHVREWLLTAQENGVSVKTQQNYRRWLRSWCNWCIEHNYMRENVTKEVKVVASGKELRNQHKRKDAKYIEPHIRERIFKWCRENDRELLLACMLEYYCFIRPREMMQLEIGLFNLHDSLIHIPDRISKNGKDDSITLPDVVAKLMIDMGIFEHESRCLLFDKDLHVSEPNKPNRGDGIRDRWLEMRKAVGVPERVKFYDLKHTGITDMMERVKVPRLVQLQARHYSITQTEAYAQEHKPKAFDEIKRLV